MTDLSKSQRLLADAREAAELRAYRTHPDVAALAIERIRTTVAVLVWTGLVLGLLFTMSNVAHFAGAGATAWSVPWLIAWLLDPMVSLCLIGVLIAESTLARYQIESGPWVRGAKWGLLSATYLMNTWSAWHAATPSLILLHSVPPAVVFVMAEAITDVRAKLTDAVLAAHRYATHTLATEVDERVGTDPAPAGAVPAADRIAQPEVTAADQHHGTGPASGENQRGTALTRDNDEPHQVQTRTRPRREDQAPRTDNAKPDVTDLLDVGRTVSNRLAARGDKLTRRALIAELRADGHQVSTNRASALLRVLTGESSRTPTEPTTDQAPGAEKASEAA
jgi:hypothetical protein